jgi:uncharacterized delta-60 repeat protein
MNGQPRTRLARLQPDGQLDRDFTPAANSDVYALAIQPDGKILVGGLFTAITGVPRNHLARLNPDGSLDATFVADAPDRPGQPTSFAGALALQADGGLLVGGRFASLGGRPRLNLARLLPGGQVDESFEAGADAAVRALAIQTDGQILVGGSFTNLAGRPQTGLGLLNLTGRAANELELQGTTIRWRRAGAVPELSFVIFEATGDGCNWQTLGWGQRSTALGQLTT